MKALTTFFVRAKHWQIFLLIVGVGWIGGAAAMLLSFAAARSPEEIFRAALPFALVMVLSMVCLGAWLWSMGSFLSSVAQPSLRLRLGFFRFALVYPLLYMFVFFAIFTSANAALLAVLFPLHFFAMFCLFYDFYFVSKSLALAETRKPASFSDYAGSFFLLWLFPIGVWFIQPRINRLFAQSFSPQDSISGEELSSRATEMPPYESQIQTVPPVYAGFWLRLAATLIDASLICFPVYIMFFFAVVVLWKITTSNGGSTSVGILAALVTMMLLAPWFYFSFLESSRWQATVGKSLLRLYVTDLEGHRLSRGRSMARNLAKCLSTLTLGVGYLMSGFTARRQALHDLIAQCVVLRRPRGRGN
jgi:uncharacterized RDD family membrane protein YckC